MAPSGFLPFVPSRRVFACFLALVAQTGVAFTLVAQTGLACFPRFLVLLSLASFMPIAIFVLVLIVALGKRVTCRKPQANRQYHKVRPNSCVHEVPRLLHSISRAAVQHTTVHVLPGVGG